MKHMQIWAAETIYACSAPNISTHLVDDAEFHGFCLALRAFTSSLESQSLDDYWLKFLRPLRSYQFVMCSTPLPFDYVMAESGQVLGDLERRLEWCRRIYPGFAQASRQLLDRLVTLSHRSSSPVFSACEKLRLQAEQGVAVVTKEGRLVPLVEKLLRERIPSTVIDVVTPSELRGETCFPELIVLGPMRWFPDLFRSPRSKQIRVIRYSWMADVRPRAPFEGSLKADHPESIARPMLVGPDEDWAIKSDTLKLFNPDEFLPTINWELLERSVFAHPSSSHDESYDDEYVAARLFQLEGGDLVPLDASPEASVTVVDSSQEEPESVRRIPVAHIEPGMFLLIRKGGEHEYIVPVADRILGQHAEHARSAQRQWKEALRAMVRRDGRDDVVYKLRQFGSGRANDANLRNWMSFRSIRTEDQRDFQAIMQLVGRTSSESADCWKTMSIIDHAHRQAGQFVRKLLLAKVQQPGNLKLLQRLGRMDLDLPDIEGVDLVIVRIESCLDGKIVRVRFSDLGRPIEIGDNPWLG
jgi:hypothetical protein